jgi:hypothetical protein
MSTQSAAGDRFPSTDAFLRAALDRAVVPINPESRGHVAVQANITTNVGHFFVAPPGSEGIAFSLNADVHPNSRTVVDPPFEIVSWEWVGVHARSFRGIPPTGRPVWFRGLTIAEEREGEELFFHQFIDWRQVILQLGMTPESSRPLVAQADIDRLAPILPTLDGGPPSSYGRSSSY